MGHVFWKPSNFKYFLVPIDIRLKGIGMHDQTYYTNNTWYWDDVLLLAYLLYWWGILNSWCPLGHRYAQCTLANTTSQSGQSLRYSSGTPFTFVNCLHSCLLVQWRSLYYNSLWKTVAYASRSAAGLARVSRWGLDSHEERKYFSSPGGVASNSCAIDASADLLPALATSDTDLNLVCCFW